MSWLGDLGDALGSLKDKAVDTGKAVGEAVAAPLGLTYDIATYVLPGDQWGSADDNGVSGLFDSIGGRALDVADPLGLGYDAKIQEGFGKTMEGLTWIGHEVIDQPLSTLLIMKSQGGPFSSEFYDPENWSKAYSIAETQSATQSLIADTAGGINGDPRPLEYYGKTRTVSENGVEREVPLTPFMDSTFTKAHPDLAYGLAFAGDIALTWYLDPAVVAGKAIGLAYQTKALGKIDSADRATFANRFDAAADTVDDAPLLKRVFKADSPATRVDQFADFARSNNMTGPEIRAVFPELKNSAAGRQLSNFLADAVKIEDDVERGNAVRRIISIGAGDISQIERLRSEVPALRSVADSLNNVVNQRTVALREQALNTQLTMNPAFRVKFNEQLKALDTEGELTRFLDDWAITAQKQYEDADTLLDSARGLDFVPGAGSTRKLKSVRGETGANLGTVERAHDNVVGKVEEATKRYRRFAGLEEGTTTVFQRGLYSVPLVVPMALKVVAATSPTKIIPAAVRGIATPQLHGYVNTHQWDTAIQQFDTMLRRGSVDDTTRLSLLSEASRLPKSGAEAQKQAIINRIEEASIQGLANRLTQQHGVTITPEFVKQSVLRGQNSRSAFAVSFDGSRRYASSTMQEGRLLSAEDVARFEEKQASIAQSRALRARGQDKIDLAQEILDKAARRDGLPVDFFDSVNGVPGALPLVSSQLANRVALFDIERAEKLASDTAYVTRLAKHSQAYTDEVADIKKLEEALATATGSNARRIMQQLDNKRKMADAILTTASGFSRAWKTSVLFRLGYPMRVIADDHLRIAAKIGYSRFFFDNVPEATKNLAYNQLLFKGGRRREARWAYGLAKARRDELQVKFGRKFPHSDKEWQEVSALAAAARKGDTSGSARLRELDPDGYLSEYLALAEDAKKLSRSAAGYRAALTRLGDGADAAKVGATRERLAAKEAELEQVQMQLGGVFKYEDMLDEWRTLEKQLGQGIKGFRPEKRQVGDAGFDVAGGLRAKGAFEGDAAAFRDLSSSGDAWRAAVLDSEENLYQSMTKGHWQTVSPDHGGYYEIWANVLNHQILNSPEYMAIVKGGVKSPQEFAAWIRKSENAYLRKRVAHYAADPEDWGGRLLAVVQDYIPTQELQDMLAKGRVTPKQLRALFPDGDSLRPHVHGQLADIQSGRHTAVRMLSNGLNNAFTKISELPTDRLSRHPYFAAIYRQEVKAAAAGHARVKGAAFGQKDLDEIERLARQRALKELETTLWDMSAQSHAGHVMRFISPFFAAHQEGLARWWGLAKEDPSLIRKWQLAFDAPRKVTWVDEDGNVQGLVVDNTDGHLVKPGEPISANHSIMVRVPFAGKNNAVDQVIKALGGGRYWKANENGFNIVLQSGVTNPGVGPLVTIPLENFVQKHADAAKFEKFARSLNAYAPQSTGFGGIALEQLLPGFAKYTVGALADDPADNAQLAQAFAQNWADDLTTWRLDHPGQEPTLAEVEELKDRALDHAHRDLALRAAGAISLFTPVRPGSKYAVIQDGLNRIREQAKREGKDYEWIQDTFLSKYGPEYDALLGVGRGTNEADIDGTPAVVSALKARRGLLDKLSNPLVTKFVIGPDVGDLTDQDADLGQETDAARAYLRGQAVTPTSGSTYYGTKSIDQMALNSAARAGWIMYDQMTEYLQEQAEERGLIAWEQDPELQAQRDAGMRAIKDIVPAFAEVWDSFTAETYTATLDDLKKVASDRKLAADPARANEIYWLGQYLILRGQIEQTLNERIAAGGARSITASPNGENADLARMMRAGMDYILSQSDNLRRYGYNGIIDRDPFLALPSAYDNQEEGQ